MSFEEWYAANHEQLCNMTVKEAFKKAYEHQPKHYSIGDIVQAENRYYVIARVRVLATAKSYLVPINIHTGEHLIGTTYILDRTESITEACDTLIAQLAAIEEGPIEYIGHAHIEVHHELS